MKYEYKEGKEARENFDKAMKSIFSVPRTVSLSEIKKKKKRLKKAASRKPGTGGD
jgi:hypothetical protein